MKKVLILAFAAMAASCTSGKFIVSGQLQAESAGDSVMVYSYFDKEIRYAGTVIGEDGSFTLEGKIDKPEVGALVLNGRSLITQLFLEKGTITAVADEDGTVNIGGTKFNEAMAKYGEQGEILEMKFTSVDPSLSPEERTAQLDAIYEEYLECLSQTVKANADNIFGAYIFATEEFRLLEGVEAQERIAEFSAEMLEYDFMSTISESVEAMLKTAIGQPYINISLAQIDGTEASVAALLAEGKYVLIDFWATWCGPCMNEMPHLKEAYAEYAPKGFEIYGVSLDRDHEDWRLTAKNLPWVNVINTEDATAASDYSVRTIPSNFLISPEGIIVAKNLRGEGIATTLAEYLK